jgi:hypothetical protein
VPTEYRPGLHGSMDVGADRTVTTRAAIYEGRVGTFDAGMMDVCQRMRTTRRARALGSHEECGAQTKRRRGRDSSLSLSLSLLSLSSPLHSLLSPQPSARPLYCAITMRRAQALPLKFPFSPDFVLGHGRRCPGGPSACTRPPLTCCSCAGVHPWRQEPRRECAGLERAMPVREAIHAARKGAASPKPSRHAADWASAFAFDEPPSCSPCCIGHSILHSLLARSLCARSPPVPGRGQLCPSVSLSFSTYLLRRPHKLHFALSFYCTDLSLVP